MIRDKNEIVNVVSEKIYEYTCEICGCEIEFTENEVEPDRVFRPILPTCPKCHGRVRVWKKYPYLHSQYMDSIR